MALAIFLDPQSRTSLADEGSENRRAGGVAVKVVVMSFRLVNLWATVG